MTYSRLYRMIVLCAIGGLCVLPGFAANIRVVTTSNLGDLLEPEIHLYQARTHKDFWPEGRQQSASDIPPGYYQIQVSSLGFRPYEQELEVGAGRTDVRAVLAPSGEATGELDLNGKVINAKSYEGLWALAFPLAGNLSDSTQSMVSSTGTFRIATAHPGPYILVLVRGDRTLGCKQVYIGVTNPEVQIRASE